MKSGDILIFIIRIISTNSSSLCKSKCGVFTEEQINTVWQK